MRLFTLLLSCLFAALAAQARSATGDRVLVVLDNLANQGDYGRFWRSLEDRGYELTFRESKDIKPTFTAFGEKQFDHLILFSPATKAFPADLNPQSLVSYLKSNANVLIGLNSMVSEAFRDFAREFTLDFEDRGTGLVDHFLYDQVLDEGRGNHTAVAVPLAHALDSKVGEQVISASTREQEAPLLFRGIAHRLPLAPLAFPVLRAPSTSYSSEVGENGSKAEPLSEQAEFLAGKEAGLVSAFQTTNNARVVFSGSTEMFQDRFAGEVKGSDGKKYSRSANAAFVDDLAKWTFQENGVLRVVGTEHHLENETQARDMYRIKDNITYAIDISEYDPMTSSWKAYVPRSESEHPQLSFTMLDPHIRRTLSPSPHPSQPLNVTRFSTTFTAPDRHGVFTFRILHRRPGWRYVEAKDTVSVRPFNHNEFDRFIPAAWPYYVGAMSTSIGFLVFCVLWVLASEPAEHKGKRKGKKAE